MLKFLRQGKLDLIFRSKTMAKLESFTFTLGIMLSSVLLVATISPIA